MKVPESFLLWKRQGRKQEGTEEIKEKYKVEGGGGEKKDEN